MPYSRRRFLTATSMAAAGLGASTQAALLTPKEVKKKPGADPKPGLPIQPWSRPLVGCQLYVWGQYYQRAGKAIDLDEVFAALKSAGYDYAEGSLNVQDHEANTAFSEKLRKHGLVPVSLYTGGEFHLLGRASQTANRIAEAAKAAKNQGFEIIVCNPDPIGRDKSVQELAIQGSALAELGQELKKAGMKLGLHHHTPELRSEAREFHANFHHTKPGDVGFCIDTHWMFRGGVPPMEALSRYADRVCSWHLRQSRAGVWWEDLDDGDINYSEIARFAKARKLPVRYTVELALEPATVITRDAAANHARSRQWVRRVFGV